MANSVEEVRKSLESINLILGIHKKRLNSRPLYYVEDEMGVSLVENMTRKSLIDTFNEGYFN